MKRVIVTGGSGFIGVNLIDSLARRGVEAVNLDVVAPPDPGQTFLWRPTDILDSAAVRAALNDVKPDTVIHLAARTDLKGKGERDYLANTVGTSNVLEAANRAGSVERILVASSRLVFDTWYIPRHTFDYHASTHYGRSKVAVEQLTMRADPGQVPWTILRPTSIWGPWFGVPYRNFFLAVSRGAYLHPRGRRIRKTMGYVGNAVHQIEQIATASLDRVAGKVFYLGDYEPIEVRRWADEIAAATGAPPIREVPVALLHLVASAGTVAGKVGLPAPLTRFRLRNLLTELSFDLGDTQDVAGDLPFSEVEGVERTVDWLRSTGAIAGR